MTPNSTSPARSMALAAVPDPAVPSAHEATSYLICDECDLSSGPMQAAEAAFLVRIHDQLQHRGRPTAHIDEAVVGEPEPTSAPTSEHTGRLVA